ncbi:MAG: polysaccharide export protein [Bacteroidales bacterium]|nr:polysaccharide export protein [Bacteroidales bacterium]MBD5229901.1 polysaccharide export protein [Bacteroidales bacterium]MBD5247506.1 polysaccharide export protein [Barnesiella sp.]MBD5258509.1 polysaccharide export protein [Barnesiella sp.]
MIKKSLLKIFVPSLLLLSSCGMPKDIVYFQDLETEKVLEIDYNNSIVAKPNDELSIVVTCQNPELAAIFNLPLVTTLAGRGTSQAYNQQVATYTVDKDGNINFPVLGTIKVEGLTRTQISDKIKGDLVANRLLEDPVVSVSFVNIFYSVTGEVTKPGRFPLDRDRMTVLDALANAGDLTIYGDRLGVKVLRREEGILKTYNIDLTNAEKVTESPAYIIQQDDVIYVTPNATRGRMSSTNGNNLISTSFWVSIASVLTSMAVLIFK